MKITWLGHSGFRIEVEQAVLLIDPALPDTWRILSRPEELGQPFAADTLPDWERLEAIIRAAVVVEGGKAAPGG